MAPLKVYVASATANPETKYRVQRTLMILDGLGIPFDSIDITKPEKAEDRKFMRENAYKDVEDRPKQVLPPQFFYNDEYLGDYDDFDASVEEDTITQFLRLLPDAIASNVDNNDTETGKNDVENGENSTGETLKKEEQKEDEEDEEDEEWEDEDEEEDEEEKEKDEKKEEEDEKTKPSEKIEEKEEKKEEEEDLEGEDEEWDEDEEEEEEEENN